MFPTAWDFRQLAACEARWCDRFEIAFAEPHDADCPSDFDVPAYIGALVAGDERVGRFDGVFSSSDYPGATVAAAIATRLGLPGSDPERVLRCSHKYYSRLAQREVAPEATAGFHLVLPDRPPPSDIAYPCFLKPVKGAFSIMSGRMDSAGELAAFLARPAAREFLDSYVTIFSALVREYTSLEVDGRAFLAEEYLPGRQATVEGYVADGEPRVLGVVESAFHPGVASFARFDLPTTMPAEIEARMADVVRRVIAHLGLRHTLFNVEMNWDPATDRVHIIEVNPRMAGQFADLYEKVLGVNGYEIALALAVGQDPPDAGLGEASGGARGRAADLAREAPPVAAEPSRPPRFSHATSFPLRVFEPCRVRHAPTPERIAEVEARFPGTLVWNECAAGQEIAGFEAEDGHSYRYAVVNVGGDSRAELLDRLERVTKVLGYAFEPL